VSGHVGSVWVLDIGPAPDPWQIGEATTVARLRQWNEMAHFDAPDKIEMQKQE
jgi:hypothetical protein